jgi:hypothetical protein
MNRAIQRNMTRRFSARKVGGGYGMGAPLVTLPSGPGSDWNFAVKQPVNQGFDDCAFPSRPGELFNQPNPALAQVAMVGGGSAAYDSPFYTAKEWPTGPVDYTYKTDPSRAAVAMAGGRRTRKMRGGAAVLDNPMYIAHEWPQVAHTSGGEATRWGDVAMAQTVMAGGKRGNCGCSGSKLFGGSRKQRGGAGCGMMRRRQRGGAGCGMMRRSSRRQQRGGGTNGYAVDPSVSVGGSGPNVAPVYAGVPCDGRAGAPNMMTPAAGSPDPRAPADLYSLTTNAAVKQAGGGIADGAGPASVGSQPPSSSYGHGNAYGPECYRAPGSELPVYNADVAGFNFRPSTEIGGTLPDGVTAYNDVVPQAARVGGARRSHKRRGSKRGSKKHRKTSRKH